MSDSEFQVDVNNMDWTSQLILLRDLTNRTGAVHEAQVLQLKLWPFTIDGNLKKTVSSVDIDNKTVRFDWIGCTLKTAKDIAKVSKLDEAVKFLFGKDWKIIVFADNLLIYPNKVLNARKKRNNRSRNSGKRRKKSGKGR